MTNMKNEAIAFTAIQFELNYAKTELRTTFATWGVSELWNMCSRNPKGVFAHVECNGEAYLADVITNHRGGALNYDCLFSGRFGTYDGALNALKGLSRNDWDVLRTAEVRPGRNRNLTLNQRILLAYESNDWFYMAETAFIVANGDDAQTYAREAKELLRRAWWDFGRLLFVALEGKGYYDPKKKVWPTHATLVEYSQRSLNGTVKSTPDYTHVVFVNVPDGGMYEIISVEENGDGIAGIILRDYASAFDYLRSIPGSRTIYGPFGVGGELLVWVPAEFIEENGRFITTETMYQANELEFIDAQLLSYAR